MKSSSSYREKESACCCMCDWFFVMSSESVGMHKDFDMQK